MKVRHYQIGLQLLLQGLFEVIIAFARKADDYVGGDC